MHLSLVDVCGVGICLLLLRLHRYRSAISNTGTPTYSNTQPTQAKSAGASVYSEIDLHERLRVAVRWRDMQAGRVGVKTLLEMVSEQCT